MMRILLLLALSLSVLGWASGTFDRQDDRLARLAWLAGCWEVAGATTVVEEQWMRPRGGSMLGMSRTTRDGRTGNWCASNGVRIGWSTLPSLRGRRGRSSWKCRSATPW